MVTVAEEGGIIIEVLDLRDILLPGDILLGNGNIPHETRRGSVLRSTANIL